MENDTSKTPLSRKVVVGIDLGATNAKAGVISRGGQLLGSASAPLGSLDPEPVVASLVAVVHEAVKKAGVRIEDVVAVGVGSPGHVYDGHIKAASNLPTWRDVPLAELLSTALSQCTVKLVNDADAAVLAECWVGEGRNCDEGSDNVAMVTLGSGVGVAVVSGGVLLQGSRGLIEAGHSIMHLGASEARLCGCGQRGCIEAYVSANSVRKRFAEERLKRFGPPASGDGDKELTTADIFALAATADGGGRAATATTIEASRDSPPLPSQGLPLPDRELVLLANEVVNETARCLALFCINLCRYYDPRIILFGGGMAEAGETLLGPVRSYFREYHWTCMEDHPDLLRLAKLGRQAGVVGAAAVVRDMLPC